MCGHAVQIDAKSPDDSAFQFHQMASDSDSLLFPRADAPDSLQVSIDSELLKSTNFPTLPTPQKPPPPEKVKQPHPVCPKPASASAQRTSRPPVKKTPPAFGSAAARFPAANESKPGANRVAADSRGCSPSNAGSHNTELLLKVLAKFEEQQKSLDTLQRQVAQLVEVCAASQPVQPEKVDKSVNCRAEHKNAVCQAEYPNRRNVRIQHTTPCHGCGNVDTARGRAPVPAAVSTPQRMIIEQLEETDTDGGRQSEQSEDSNSRPTTADKASDTTNSSEGAQFATAERPVKKRVTYGKDEYILRECQNDVYSMPSMYVNQLAVKYLPQGDVGRYLNPKPANVLDNRKPRSKPGPVGSLGCPPFTRRPSSQSKPAERPKTTATRVQEKYAVAMYSQVLYDFVAESTDAVTSSTKAPMPSTAATAGSVSPKMHSRSFSGVPTKGSPPPDVLMNRSYRASENRSPLDNRCPGRSGIMASRKFDTLPAGQPDQWSFAQDSDESPSPLTPENVDSDFSGVFSDEEG